jgi:DNA-binding PadR family transcriptional regulator
MANKKANVPLTPAVLHILLALSTKERHGYGIMKEVEADSEGKVKMGPGTLYGSLGRMLEAGLICESDKKRDPDMDDERRIYYKITGLGGLAAELEPRDMIAEQKPCTQQLRIPHIPLTHVQNLCAKLLRLPKPCDNWRRNGQTFNDICASGEKREADCSVSPFGFAETSAGIIRENITVALMQNITRRLMVWAVVVALVLFIPLVAMQFTSEVNWTLSDFVFAGVLLFGTGLTYELVARKAGGIAYRAAVGVALGAAFLLVWINAAVGIIGNEDNPANLMYLGVLAVLTIGIAMARLRPRGMVRVLFATALAQMLVPVIALIAWRPSLDDAPGILGVFVLNAFFVMLFVVSAFLFRRAAQEDNRCLIAS